MKKKLLTTLLCAGLLLVGTIPAYAFDVPEYRFDGPKNDELYDASGIITAESGTQIILPDDTKETILPYGVTMIGPSYAGSSGGLQNSSAPVSIGADGYPDVWGNSTSYGQTTVSGYTPDTSYYPAADVSLSVLTQKDNSLGSISIPAIKINVKVYENDMSKGVGHIPGTALWNGNVGIMGHNRGTNNYFAKLKDMKAGDKITLSTNQGTRVYVVTFSGTISATDWSMLEATANNRLTLISCVMDTPSLRQCIQAVEVR